MKRLALSFGMALMILAVIASISFVAQATTVGPNSPGTMADNATVGTVAWSNPDNAKVSDDVRAKAYFGHDHQNKNYDDIVSIVKSDGTIGIADKANATIWPTVANQYFSYGSSSDLWSEFWTAEYINDVDFGVVVSAKNTYSTVLYSHYLKATNFGFSIPTGATINGILVEIEKDSDFNGGAWVDHIRITVYYTEAAGGPSTCYTQTANSITIPANCSMTIASGGKVN